MSAAQHAAAAHLQGIEERVSQLMARGVEASTTCVWPTLRQLVAALRGLEARVSALEAGGGRASRVRATIFAYGVS